MHTLARVSKTSQTQDYEWTPIRDTAPRSPNFGNSSHSSAFIAANNRPKARLSRPPNLPFAVPAPYGISPPESPLPNGYAQPRRSSKSARQGYVESRRPSVRPISTVDETEDGTGEQKANSPGGGVRTGEVAKMPRLKNRISTVSQYPVFVNSSRNSYMQSSGDVRTRNGPRGSRRRRPMSIASTSTTGIYLAVGALPGSEPFDISPPAQDMRERHDAGRTGLTHATMNPPRQRPGSLLRPMSSATASRASVTSQNEHSGTTTTTIVKDQTGRRRQQHRYSLVSRMPTNYAGSDTSSRHTVSDCDESVVNSDEEDEEDREEGIAEEDDHDPAADGAGERTQSQLDPRHMQWLKETAAPAAELELDSESDDRPPTPPAKDEKHLLRPPTSNNAAGAGGAARLSTESRTLRATASSPNLSTAAQLRPPPATTVRERTGVVRERSGTWYEQPMTLGREWLSSLRASRAPAATQQPQQQQQHRSTFGDVVNWRRSRADTFDNAGGSARWYARQQAQTHEAPVEEGAAAAEVFRTKRSQLFALWSRIIGRAMPRLGGVHSKKA